MIPFFVTVPHAGEELPAEVDWLKGLPETVLMCDVDRYVDQLYKPAVLNLGVPHVMANTHRYVVDLNRVPTDIDADSVEGCENPSGMFSTGYHWSRTTTGVVLLKRPISNSLHQLITEKFYKPFHSQVQAIYDDFKIKGYKKVYHLDAHSMPSRGTAAHRDPGSDRPQIVVSDRDGKSCEANFKDLVIGAYERVGFEVAYNWPYKGGRITESYGQPLKGQNALQVEMNRSLYMDEMNKQKLTDEFKNVQNNITRALAYIYEGIRGF